MKGIVLAVHSAHCRVVVNSHNYTCKLRGKLRMRGFSIMAGDLVKVVRTGSTVVIEEVLERKNFLVRPPMANVEQAVVVTAVTQPPLDLLNIDRILVHLEQQGIRAIVCVNKVDIEKWAEISRILKIYARAGYKAVATSAVTGCGIDQLRGNLDGCITIMAGASGVGKSKIISKLLGKSVTTGSLSRKKRGRHVTKGVTLFPVGENGYLADTPGFSKLDAIDCEPYELAYYFPEMSEYAHLCHYPRCLHKTEDRCYIRDKVEKNEIDRERYENYLSLLDEVIERTKRKYE